MKLGVRIIIIDEKKVLIIHRNKFGREYYVIPGGAIDPGETPEQAAIRETKEETNFDVKPKFVQEMIEEVEGEKRKFYLFKARAKGEPELVGPEKEINCQDNSYHLEWVELSRINELFMYPQGIQKIILSTS